MESACDVAVVEVDAVEDDLVVSSVAEEVADGVIVVEVADVGATISLLVVDVLVTDVVDGAGVGVLVVDVVVTEVVDVGIAVGVLVVDVVVTAVLAPLAVLPVEALPL